MSGVFAVTFSIVFAYVADVTDEADRSSAYGLVSATFAASLVTSPALGAYLGSVSFGRRRGVRREEIGNGMEGKGVGWRMGRRGRRKKRK